METHIMIDHETMGTGPTAAVIQVGVAAFRYIPHDQQIHPSTPRHMEVFAEFEATISLQSAILLGCTIDQDTINWWRSQPKEAQAAVTYGAKEIGIVMTELRVWLKSIGEIHGVWSHGASFDIPQLDFIFSQLGLKAPWKYSAVRDTRTVHWLAQQAGWKLERGKVAHTALADAKAQVKTLHEAIAKLDLRPF